LLRADFRESREADIDVLAAGGLVAVDRNDYFRAGLKKGERFGANVQRNVIRGESFCGCGQNSVEINFHVFVMIDEKLEVFVCGIGESDLTP